MIKITDLSELALVLKGIKKQNSRIVLAGGCFDLLHTGHVVFLEKAKKEGDFLIILLESDQKISRLKGKGRPVNSQQDRAKVLAALESIDLVVCLPDMKNEDYDRVVKLIKPQIIATTEGDLSVEYKKRTAKLVNAEVKFVSTLLENYSTGKIIDRIATVKNENS